MRQREKLAGLGYSLSRVTWTLINSFPWGTFLKKIENFENISKWLPSYSENQEGALSPLNLNWYLAGDPGGKTNRKEGFQTASSLFLTLRIVHMDTSEIHLLKLWLSCYWLLLTVKLSFFISTRLSKFRDSGLPPLIDLRSVFWFSNGSVYSISWATSMLVPRDRVCFLLLRVIKKCFQTLLNACERGDKAPSVVNHCYCTT